MPQSYVVRKFENGSGHGTIVLKTQNYNEAEERALFGNKLATASRMPLQYRVGVVA